MIIQTNSCMNIYLYVFCILLALTYCNNFNWVYYYLLGGLDLLFLRIMAM